MKKYIEYALQNGFCTISTSFNINIKYNKESGTLKLLLLNRIVLAEYDFNIEDFINNIESVEVKLYLQNKELTILEEQKEKEFLQYYINEFKNGLICNE